MLLLFYFLAFWPRGMRTRSSLTKDWTHTPCIGRWSLNYWTAREIPRIRFLMMEFQTCNNWKGFPGGSVVKNYPANAGDMGSVSESERSPGKEKGNFTPVFLPGKSHGQRSLAGFSLWGHKESDTTEQQNNNSKQLKTTWRKEVLLMGCQSSYVCALV